MPFPGGTVHQAQRPEHQLYIATTVAAQSNSVTSGIISSERVISISPLRKYFGK